MSSKISFRIHIQLFLAIVLVSFGGSTISHAAVYVPPESHHLDLNFNFDWKYLKGTAANAGAAEFDDANWATVSLPHTCNDDKFREWISTRNDKIVEKHFEGITWYRKHLAIGPEWAGRKFILEFQGITLVGTFFVNGKPAGFHESGVGPCGSTLPAWCIPVTT